jgi:hypothetical protein
MDLSTFVKETLVQLVKGVSEAQTEVESYGAAVNPEHELVTLFAQGAKKNPRAFGNYVEEISFDVAVTATDKVDVGGGLKVSVISGKAERSDSRETEHRVKFKIPLVFPKRGSVVTADARMNS